VGKCYLSWYNTTPATIPNGAVLFELKFNGVAGAEYHQLDTQTPGYCEYSDINGQIIFSTWINGMLLYSITNNYCPTTNSIIYSGGSTYFSISASGNAWLIYGRKALMVEIPGLP